MEEFIQSRQNPRIKAVAKLQDRAGRNKMGLFAVEGLRELERCAKTGMPLEEIYFCPEFFKSDEHSHFIEGARGKHPLCRLSEGAFEKISNREGCDGLLGVCAQWPLDLQGIKVPQNLSAKILIADGVEKPGNLGALMRTADSLGANALILSNPVTDIFNPAVVRASQGAIFSIKTAVDTPQNIDAWLKSNGFTSYAAYLQAPQSLRECKFAKRSAVIVGSEKDGLGADWINIADEKVIIPMTGISDSLNVNVAAAIFLWQASL